MGIADSIRREERFVAMCDERCHHFTKGPCRACADEARIARLGAELDVAQAELQAACDNGEPNIIPLLDRISGLYDDIYG